MGTQSGCDAGAARHRSLRAIGVAVVVTVAAGFGAGTPSPADAQTACALVPQLRDVTINQGLGSYPRLARGKETLVKFFLSLPSCAPAGSSIVRTGGSMRMQVGSTVATVQSSTPAPVASAPPPLVPFGAAPALDSTGDPTFVVPGPLLTSADPGATFPATFTATIQYSFKTSPGAPAVPGVLQVTTRPGSTSPIQATVDKRTNALRVLLVPMGDPTKPYDTQFSPAARTAAVNGMTTVSRVFPLPSGTSDLGGTAGLRYTLNPALLDIRSVMSNGQFCGTGANFEPLKGPLAATLLAWNTKNPTKPADRVVGVVDAAISPGTSCADGFGAVGGTVAWARAVPATAATPSRTGAVMAMELGHTLGLVPRTRSLFSDPYHSPNQQADVTSVNRGYNVARRSFVSDDRTALRVSGTWHNDSILLERDDWSYLLCTFGGTAGGGCTTPGTVGSSTGVGAEPTFVISGTTDGTSAGTDVVNSYFSPGVPRSDPVTGGALSLVQLTGGGTLRTDPVALETATSEHHGDDAGSTDHAHVFAAAVPFATGADRIELRQGATVLYARDRSDPPVGGTTSVGPGSGITYGPVEIASVSSTGVFGNGASPAYDVSDDGRFVAFVSTATNLDAADTTNDQDVYVRDRLAGTTELVSVNSNEDPDTASGCAEPGISGGGRYVALYCSSATLVPGDTNGQYDVFVRDRQLGTTERVSLDVNDNQVAAGADLSNTPPAISSDGRYVVFGGNSPDYVPGDTNGSSDIYLRDRGAGTTERVSLTDGEGEFQGSSPTSLDVSDDGRFVAFNALAPVTTFDVFVRDRQAGTTDQVSVDSAENDGNNPSLDGIDMSDDGRFVVFYSGATNLVAGDTNGVIDVFLRDRQDGTTERASVDGGGGQLVGQSTFPTVSDDGRFVSFLVGDSPPVAQVRDRQDGTTTSPAADAFRARVTADGGFVTFVSNAPYVTGEPGFFYDAFLRPITPGAGAGDAVTTGGTDDVPEDARVDLFIDCGDGNVHPVAVGLAASSITGDAIDFAYSFDPAVSCTGGEVTALLNDGFSTASTPGEPVESDPGNRDPLPAVAQPTPGTSLLAYDVIALRGAAKDAEDGELGNAALSWALDGNGVGSGPVVDLSPPTGGWSPGSHTATLTATDGDGASSSTSVSFTIAGDADNDGVPTTVETGCAGGSDSDPSDGYADADGDGIGNGDDQTTTGGPCSAATSYAAVVDVTPNTLDKNSTSEPVRARITIPFQSVAAVLPSSVRISRIGGVDADIQATSVTVSGGVATATFDRGTVNAFIRAQGTGRNEAAFTIIGGSGTWTFEGSETVQTK